MKKKVLFEIHKNKNKCVMKTAINLGRYRITVPGRIHTAIRNNVCPFIQPYTEHGLLSPSSDICLLIIARLFNLFSSVLIQ